MQQKVKKRKLNCGVHPRKDRAWENYYLSYTSSDGIEFYYCIECKKQQNREDERWQRIKDNEKRQREQSDELFYKKMVERQAYREKSRREQIWDDEVNKELMKGMKQKHLIEFPKEMLQLKRATMKLSRLIKHIKKINIDKLKKELKEEQIILIKLNTPLIKCQKHGELFLKDVIKSGKSKWTGEQLYKCRECMSNIKKKHYINNKDLVLKKNAEYRVKNPEVVKDNRRKSWRNNVKAKNNEHENVT